MKPNHMKILFLLTTVLLFTADAGAQQGGNTVTKALPPEDLRAARVRGVRVPVELARYDTKEQWLARAAYLREHILVSTGLWPTPPKAPLNARVFDRTERDDYTIEKVYFESVPGFYVTGNLYRPRGKKSGPFPAVLTPHGHWAYGRLENTTDNSVPGRAISLARQGYVVFTYDMIGYNDSRQLQHHLRIDLQKETNTEAAVAKRLSLWGTGALALQMWNSVRAVDFLESLPDVDRERIACTGESGGATQTFLLGAIDQRVKFAAPVNMISRSMQGGCVCENAANLRLDTNNVEFGSLIAPRPLLMISATGDWTRDSPTVEYPAIRRIYQLLGAEDQISHAQFDAPHNYNRDSREAVYAWLGRRVLGENDPAKFKEKNFTAEDPARLLVFHGRALPPEAKTQEQLFAHLIETFRNQLNQMRPHDAETLRRFRETMRPALAHSLAAEYPRPQELIAEPNVATRPGESAEFFIGRANLGDRIPARLWTPSKQPTAATLVVHPAGRSAIEKTDLVESLLKKGHSVMAIDAFDTGRAKIAARAEAADATPFFATYNRTDDANRVQDVLTALAFLQSRGGASKVNLIGLGDAGLWCLLARALAPELGQTAVDAAQFESEADAAYLEKLYVPVLRRAGDFKTALTLPAAARLLIFNTGGKFETEWAARAYEIQAARDQLRIEAGALTAAQVSGWID